MEVEVNKQIGAASVLMPTLHWSFVVKRFTGQLRHLGCLPNSSLLRCPGQVPSIGCPWEDPGHAEEIMSLAWKRLRIIPGRARQSSWGEGSPGCPAVKDRWMNGVSFFAMFSIVHKHGVWWIKGRAFFSYYNLRYNSFVTVIQRKMGSQNSCTKSISG